MRVLPSDQTPAVLGKASMLDMLVKLYELERLGAYENLLV